MPGPWRDRAIGFVSWFVTLHGVVLTGVFFRAESVRGALDHVGGILTWRDPVPYAEGYDVTVALGNLVPAAVFMLMFDLAQRRFRSATPFLALPRAVRGAFYGAAVALILVYSGSTAEPFIYFQF